jgi:ATP-binding cassette, subfamily G (WHITE), member 2, SNQ2
MSGLAAPVVGAGVIPPTEQQIEASKHTARANNVESSSSSQTQAGEAGHQVNVKDAERAFEELRRQLSTASSLHRTRTGEKDPEKEGQDSDDFDLSEYLNNSLEARDNAGFKRKVVGVTWDNLRVTGAGGMKVRLPTAQHSLSETARPPVSRPRATTASESDRAANAESLTFCFCAFGDRTDLHVGR